MKSRENTFLTLYTLILFALVVIQVTFANRQTWGDEDGLYNPIYMYQHFGKVTYPMQLQFDYMTIHPPTHYFIVGLLAKAGLQVFYAAAVPLVIMTLVSFAAILTAGFSNLAKLSLLTGFTLATLVYTPLATIRPDMQVTFAWFCGLVLLEAARSLGWENKRLFLGSFFVAYASGLHYPAGVSALMLPAYFLYILIRPAGVRPWIKLLPIVAGALLFYIPFAVYFVIPYFRPIVDMLKAANATGGGTRAAIQSQYLQFDAWVNKAWPLEFPALGRLIFLPVSKLRIPPVACAVPVLFLCRSLRGMALAGSILPLFVFTMVSRKGGLFYIAPELILYSVAVCVVFFWSVEWLGARIRPDQPLFAHVAASILAALVLARSGEASRSGLTPRLLDWEVARAANQKIIGRNALAAINQCYDWYTCGAGKLYWIVTHTDWDSMQLMEQKRKFDSIVVLGDWFANGHETIPFPEFYVDGKLNLRGFYFAGRSDSKLPFDQVIPMLHLSARNDLPKQGFGYDRERRILNYYVEDPQGPWVFATFKAFLRFPEEWPRDTVYLKRFDMQQPVGDEPGLFAMITAQPNWVRDRPGFAARGKIRDEVRMSMREIGVADLLRNAPPERVEFITNQADVR